MGNLAPDVEEIVDPIGSAMSGTHASHGVIVTNQAGLDTLRESVVSSLKQNRMFQVRPVSMELQTRVSLEGNTYDSFMVTFERHREGLPSIEERVSAPLRSAEGKLLLCLDIGCLYEVTIDKNDKGYMFWAKAELIEENEQSEPAL